jgi:hypothetical protein
VAWTAANDLDGSFSLALPLAAPVWAPYAAAPAAITFSADSTATGLYRLRAAAGDATKEQAVDTKAAVLPPVLFTFP